jgi:hypothetical protein
MQTHKLKIDAQPFADLASGVKTGEVRNDDRGFEVGDIVHLTCVDGRTMDRVISHIQRGYGLPDGICVLSYTRPIAPVDGLETVAWRFRDLWEGGHKHWKFTERHYKLEDTEFQELVTRSQAEAIIAAKDAEWQAAAKLGSEVNRNLANRVNALQADNAAVTAQRDALIEAGLKCCNGTPNPELPRFDLALSFINSTSAARKAADIVWQDLKADNAALSARVKELQADRDSWRRVSERLERDSVRQASEMGCLSTKLAAAKKALEFYADVRKYPAPLTGGMGELWSDCGAIARAALEAKP